MEHIKSSKTIDTSFLDKRELAGAKRIARNKIMVHLTNQMYLLPLMNPTEKQGRDTVKLTTELVVMTKSEYEKLISK